ncbi:MAG: MnhB domain-containing protein [Actinocrinis sp.]
MDGDAIGKNPTGYNLARAHLVAWGYSPGGGFPGGAVLLGVLLLVYAGFGRRRIARVARPAAQRRPGLGAGRGRRARCGGGREMIAANYLASAALFCLGLAERVQRVRRSAARAAMAMMVSAGLAEPWVGSTLPSTM